MVVSRRALLGGAATAVVAGGVAAGTNRPRRARADTAPTLPVRVVNNSGSDTLWCYVAGIDPGTGAPLFLTNDGTTADSAAEVGIDGGKLAAKYAIPVTSSVTLNIPHMISGRVWFSPGTKLTLGADARSGVHQPSVAAGAADPNHHVAWDFCELTYDSSQLYANLTSVDFASLPVSMSMGEQEVGGLVPGALASMAAKLEAQAAKDGGPWEKLVVRNDDGDLLRVVSPNLAGADFSGYYEPYVDKVWDRFRSRDLLIDLQNGAGKVRGRVVGDVLTFEGHGSFRKPSTADIFNCSSGPFTTGNDTMGAISARLAAAFNRSSLLLGDTFPGLYPSYAETITNHYARVVHEVEQDGLGYAFPYDDVFATGGRDVQGKIQSSNPSTLTLTVGKRS